MEYSKKVDKPMFEILYNFDITLATKTQILLYARKDQLDDAS